MQLHSLNSLSPLSQCCVTLFFLLLPFPSSSPLSPSPSLPPPLPLPPSSPLSPPSLLPFTPSSPLSLSSLLPFPPSSLFSPPLSSLGTLCQWQLCDGDLFYVFLRPQSQEEVKPQVLPAVEKSIGKTLNTLSDYTCIKKEHYT